MGEVEHRIEVVAKFASLLHPPVIDHDDDVCINVRRFPFLHDQRAVEPPCDLFPGTAVRVVPEGACVGRDESIREIVPVWDGVLRQARNSVHRVVDPDAMPVDRRRLPGPVFEIHEEFVALPDPKDRPGRAPVESDRRGGA